ncbi:MAG: PAS domain-containing protein [Planctomycetes bacterium]|nr:PAS domain-containing protein [Planctomycetota bacterium]
MSDSALPPPPAAAPAPAPFAPERTARATPVPSPAAPPPPPLPFPRPLPPAPLPPPPAASIAPSALPDTPGSISGIYPVSRRRLFVGPALTLLGIAAIECAALLGFRVSNPPIMLTLLVVYSAFLGGIAPGLMSAVLVVAHATLWFSLPGSLLHYTDENRIRILVLGLFLPPLPIMVGVLKRRAEEAVRHRLQMERETNLELAAEVARRETLERALRDSEDRLHLALKSADIGIWVWDLTDGSIFWDEYMHPLYGLAPGSFGGRFEDYLALVHPDDRAAIRTRGADLFAGRDDVSSETRIVWPDGSIHTIASRGKLLRDAAGRGLRMTGVCWDDTERCRARADLEHKNAQLAAERERAAAESRFKSRFLASMSHELRTPLNAIVGFTDLLALGECGPLPPQQSEFVKIIAASSRDLLHLVDEVLDISKIEAGRTTLVREWIDPAVVIGSARDVVEGMAAARGVTLDAVIPADLPVVYLDPMRIKQVLYNLLSNGVKFTPKGGTVRLRAAVDGDRLAVTVEDTGIGIRADDLPRLFREFERIENGAAAPPQGSGLGLALSRRLAELHGGTIMVTSKPGAGSAFTVRLPLLSRVETVAAEGAPVPTPGAGAPRVLLVENDPRAAEALAGRLRAAALTVFVAARAEEAERLAAEHLPAAIVLDVQLAGGDGWALLERFKRLPATAATPIIVLSALDQPNRGFLLGADDYLVKPVAPQALLDSLRLVGVPLQIDKTA